MVRKRTKTLPPDHPYIRRLIRERVQSWLLDFNASDPVVTVEGEIRVDLGLTRRQVEHLSDFITERMVEQKAKDKNDN